MNRRNFLRVGAASTALVVAGCSDDAGVTAPEQISPNPPGPWSMPDEGVPHARTWMALGPSREIWGEQVNNVRTDLAGIAHAIAAHEPVSMLVRPADLEVAKNLLGSDVDIVECPIDDLWMRDTGPIFVSTGAAEGAVSFNFNGWGDKQTHAADARVAEFVAADQRVPSLHTNLVMEGGAIEVDGQGTAIITESCVLNDNRNPGVTKQDVEEQLSMLLGITAVIWLPGIRGRDITDGHTDFYARFTSPGAVVAAYDDDPESFDHAVTIDHMQILGAATDARGRRLKVVSLTAPAELRAANAADDFAAGYVNFYVCNGAIIAPQFGDSAADGDARSTLTELYPGREIIQLNIDALAAGGGGIHCTTQQQPTP